MSTILYLICSLISLDRGMMCCSLSMRASLCQTGFIYIYAFSRHFYPKRLTTGSVFRLYIFCQYVCSLGIEPTTFCTANAMRYNWVTGTQFHIIEHIILSDFLIQQVLTIDSRWGSGLVSLLAGQAHQHSVTSHLTNFWCFWQCGQVPNPAGKWNQHLLKSWSAEGSMKCSNISW